MVTLLLVLQWLPCCGKQLPNPLYHHGNTTQAFPEAVAEKGVFGGDVVEIAEQHDSLPGVLAEKLLQARREAKAKEGGKGEPGNTEAAA